VSRTRTFPLGFGVVAGLVVFLGLPRPTSAADCNLNGTEDRTEIDAGTSADCNLDGVPDECEFVPLQFGLREQNQPVVPEALAAVSVDLNADGIDELVIGSRDPSRPRESIATVFLGRAESRIDRSAEYPAGTNLSALAAADLDSDGDLDLVSANSTEILILANMGDGTFAAPTGFATPQFTRFVTTGDVTGDGVPEIIAANNTDDRVTVFSNPGDGTFPILAEVSGGERPVDVALSDVDGDLDLDLVVAYQDSNRVTVHTNFGEGRFSAVGSSIEPGNRPSSVAADDLDGDGDKDLVVAAASSILSIWWNQGDGTFLPAPALAPMASSVAIADFDRNGTPDVAALASSSRGVWFLLNDGAGRFGAEQLSSVDISIVTPGDFDGDGAIDLALTGTRTNTTTVLWSGVRRTFELRESQEVAIDARPHGAAVGDVNGDGLDDVLVGTGPEHAIAVLINQGNDTLPAGERFDTHTIRVEDVAAGDLDQDGDIDMVGADTAADLLVVFLNPGDGRFSETTSYKAGTQPRWVTAVDLTGDGFPDLVHSNSDSNTISRRDNLGDATFGPRTTIRVGLGPRGIAPQDYDGDGDIDLAVSNAQSGTISLLFNDGPEVGGAFSPVEVLAVPGTANFVVGGDLDGDGAPDLAVASASDSTVAIFPNAGGGAFPDVSLVALGREVPGYVGAADIDRDGDLDLVTANGGSCSISVLAGLGDGTFPFPIHYRAGIIPLVTLAVDLGGDGDLDLVSADHDSWLMRVFANELPAVDLDLDFLERVCTERDFEGLSLPSNGGSNVQAATKYTLAVRDDPELLPTVFQNSNRFLLHQEFLAGAFPERFPALSVEDYNNLIFLRASRQYYVGVLRRLGTEDGIAYGFSVVTDTFDDAELLSLEEVREIRTRLQDVFQLEPFGYFPDDFRTREVAAGWVNPGFPVYLDDGAPRVTFQAYTRAVGYGRVRVLDEDGFMAANESGQVSFQNILVLERAPRDIEGVVGGVITAEPQGELSHLSIRTARRNTPNAFVEDAVAAFAPWEGKLVRLEVTDSEYFVEEVEPEEAEDFWMSNRPEISEIASFDPDFPQLSSLAEIADLDRGEPQESRFGGKATNLARLGGILEAGPFAHFSEAGFAIPIHHYLEFMRSNRMPSALDPSREVTYEEHLFELFTSPEFQSDSSVRFRALDEFRDVARDEGKVSDALVDDIVRRIGEIFPSTKTPVRFRSSSNVEDALEFNGAGLYESTGGCADDTLDGDDDGPSLCDPSKSNERGIRRALKKVWTSLYTFRAFEERSFFGVPEENVGMGILVSRAFPDELANGVAFTGNLSNPRDKRYVIIAQAGEASVVSPEPGVLPEKDVLEIVDGQVSHILRPQRGSSLVPPGTFVLSDANLQELGAVMSFVDANFPLELGSHPRENVLLDMEFKLEPAGTLAIKQVRPFLLSVEALPTPTFELVIPSGLEVCGTFQVAGASRGALEEYRLKSRLRLRGGSYPLETASETFGVDLIDELVVQEFLSAQDPGGLRGQEVATAVSEGLLRFLRLPTPSGATRYRFTYEQDFVLAGGEMLRVEFISGLEYEADGDEVLSGPRVLEESTFTTLIGREILQLSIDEKPLVRYGSCSYASLPAFEIAATLEDGTSLNLVERWLEPENLLETGAAAVVRADVTLGGVSSRITDYWQLVYSAFRHNTGIQYWVVLDDPVRLPGVAEEVVAIELIPPEANGATEARATYLGADFQEIQAVPVVTFGRRMLEEIPGDVFLRGDSSGDGTLNVLDATRVLDHLFRRQPLGCRKAADADDDGKVTVLDAIRIAERLFRRSMPLPSPSGSCGLDPTDDDLSCLEVPSC